MKYDDVKRGKMYVGHNNDPKGHPSLVVNKNKNDRIITIVKFTHKKNKLVENEPLKVSISKVPGEETYILKFPYKVSSKSLSKSDKFKNYKVDKKDKYRVEE